MGSDFFISYTSADRAWAEWIARVLEDHGYSAVLQAWDFHPGSDFVADMDRAMRTTARTLVVLSRAYEQASFTVPEWTNALARDPTGRLGILVPVRVEEFQPEGIFRTRTYLDLARTTDEDSRKRLLLEGLQRERIPARSPGMPTGERPRLPGSLPPVWRVPHGRNPAFVDRDDVLAQLHQSCRSASRAPALAALVGLGGVGKTALAVEFCHRHSDDYKVVWWCRAAQREFLSLDLAALTKPLGLPCPATEGVAAQLQAVLYWLEHNDQWLLVLDGIEDPSLLSGLPQGGGGHILLTSRRPDWRRFVSAQLQLEPLDPRGAHQLLSLRTGQPEDRELATVAELLGFLPLALELAAAFVERQGIGFEEYRRRLQKRSIRLLDSGGTPPDYPHTLVGAWAESFSVVQHQSPAAAELLQLLGFLAPEWLPRRILSNGARVLPGQLAQAVKDVSALSNLLSIPRGYSLIQTSSHELSMHRLVQAVLRESLPVERQRELAGAALQLVQYTFPLQVGDTRLWARATQLLPHAEAVLSHGERLEVAPAPDAARLMERIAGFLWATHLRPEDTQGFFERALRQAERFAPSDLGHILNNFGLAFLQQGDAATARTYLERSIELDQHRLGAEAPSVGVSLVNLGMLLRDQAAEDDREALEQARGYLERGVAILDRAVGPADTKVATAHSHLGQLLFMLGEYEAAAVEFQRAYDSYVSVLGVSSQDAVLALEFLNQARARATGASTHPPTFTVDVLTPARVTRDEGAALASEPSAADEAEEKLQDAMQEGDGRAAFELFRLLEKKPERREEALQALEKALDAGVPEAQYHVGRRLVELERPGTAEDAEKLLRAALRGGVKAAWYDLGLVLHQQPGREAEAEAAYREALREGYEEARNDLGLLLLGLPGRAEEGERELRQTGAAGHPRALYNLGLFLSEQPGRREDAIRVYQEAIARGYSQAWLNLGILWAEDGRREDAERALRSACAAGMALGYFNLGAFYDKEGRWREAEQAYEEAIRRGIDARERLARVKRQLQGSGTEAGEPAG